MSSFLAVEETSRQPRIRGLTQQTHRYILLGHWSYLWERVDEREGVTKAVPGWGCGQRGEGIVVRRVGYFRFASEGKEILMETWETGRRWWLT